MSQQNNQWRTKLGATGTVFIAILIAVVLLLVNVLGNYFFLRADLTADQQYSITQASKETVRDLVDPVTIKIFVSDDVPQFRFVRSFIKDITDEYLAYARGNLTVQFLDPATDEQIKQEAIDHGINPVQLQVRTSEGVSVRNVYSGIIVYQGEKSEAITQILDTKLEYDLTSAIRKVTRQKQVRLAFAGGHGQHSKAGDYGAVVAELERLYPVEEVNLDSLKKVPDYDALIVAGPREDFSQKELFFLDQYLLKGGKLMVLLDAVVQDEAGQPKFVSSNIKDLLLHYGLRTYTDLIIDPQQNFAQMLNIFISRPIPWVVKLLLQGDHPIIKQLGQFFLPFANTLQRVEQPPAGVEFTDLAFTSAASWAERDPEAFATGELSLTAEKPRGPFLVTTVLQGKFPSYFGDKALPLKDIEAVKEASGDGRLLVVGGAQFLTNSNVSVQAGNAQFFLNSIDWLAADSALIQIRSKAAAERKIEELGPGKQQLVRAINFALAPLIVIIIGLAGWWRRRKRKVTLADI